MAKKTIRVHTPFGFTHDDGTKQRFAAGEHVVDQAVAEHWFVLAHAEVSGNAKAAADTTEFQAQIASLTAQLSEQEKTIAELQVAGGEKDEQIASLTAQLAALQTPAKPVEETTDGTKSKSASTK